MLLFSLALRNLLRQKLRNTISALAIGSGVVALILSGGFVQDIVTQLGEAFIHSHTGHLQLFQKGYYEAGTRSPEKYLIREPEQLRRTMAAQPEVADIMARVQFAGLLNNGRTDWAIVGEGIEPDKEARLGSALHISQGRQLKDSDAFGILLGEGVARALRLKAGDRVTLVASAAEGALNSLDFEVVGVFQSFSKDYDARAIRIALPAAQELLFTQGVNSLVISLHKTGATDAVAARLKPQLDKAGYDIKTWVELNDFYEKTVTLYQYQFGVLQFIILAMVVLSVANSINMNVFERLGEFGTMRALGNRSSHVFRLILTESAALGLLSALAGVMIGTALALAISAIGIPMPPPPNANLGYTAQIRIIPSVLLMAYSVGVAATVLGAILPAMRVSRTPVLDALRANI